MKKIIILAAVATIAVACAKKDDNAATPTASVFDTGSVQNAREITYVEATRLAREERRLPALILTSPNAVKVVRSNFRGDIRTATVTKNLQSNATSTLPNEEDFELNRVLQGTMAQVEPIVCRVMETIKPEYAASRPRGKFYVGSVVLAAGKLMVNAMTSVTYSSQKLIDCQDGSEGKGFIRTTRTIVPRLQLSIPDPSIKVKTEVIIDGEVVETLDIELSEIQAQ